MMPSDRGATERTLTSDNLLLRVVAGDGEPIVAELLDRRTGQALLPIAAPLCAFAPAPASGDAASIDGQDGEIRVRWHGDGETAAAEAVVTLDGPRLGCRVEATTTTTPAVRFPFLDALFAGEHMDGRERLIAGEAAFRDCHGRPIVRHADWPLPTVRVGPDGRTLTLLSGLGVWEAGPAGGIGAPLPGAIFEAELVVHDGGWPAAFDLFRRRVRDRFDLAQYRRLDLAWYRDQLVQHFTFLYGREILNLETGEFELDRFLDEAERDFGGYDGMLIWGVYPRIGVDERTQWDFHDDLPGGRAGLRAMARRARERGVRFFIPFKPWDDSAELHGRPGEPPHEPLAELAADVEADGVFLDTMSAISPEFREALDRARPGVVFCSEGRAKGPALEMITGSWEQSTLRDADAGNWSAVEERMPGVDLWRFVFPEHPLFVVNRHAVGDDRMRIIQRGFFGGMGWVVWQDIFGLVLTYSPEEAALLKRCRTIAREHLSALRGPCPTPLLDTLIPGVYANEFPGKSKRLWTFYNETNVPVAGPVLRIQPTPDWHVVDVWADEETVVEGDGRLHVTLGPHAVGAVAELPRVLAFDPETGRLAVDGAAPDARIEIRGSDHTWSCTAGDLPIEIRTVEWDVSGPTLVRMIAAGELIDQIALPPAAGEDRR